MNSQLALRSPLADPTALPLRLSTTVAEFSSTLVVAPHPDDESLGCGGAIGLLRSLGCAVQVLVMSDGTLSHPHSRRYPALALRVLREAETQSAMSILGVNAAAVTFLRLQDGSIPTSEAVGFEQTVSACQNYLAKLAPKTIFLPWRWDPHPDHRATWMIIQAAIGNLQALPRVIQYPIWDWDPEQRGNISTSEQMVGWRLDISSVLELKLRAIAAYRSQTTNLIDDDPEGFRLTPEMLSNFVQSWEVYLEEL